MAEQQVYGIGEFRQRATEIIKQVEESAQPVQIARRGKPVVEIRPLVPEATDLLGSVTVADGVDLTAPAVDPSEWSAGE